MKDNIWLARTRKLTIHPRSRDLGAGLLLLCALLVFVPNLNGYFLSDDFMLLSWTRTHSFSDVATFFDPNTIWFYRPGVKVIYWLEQSLFGLHAVPYHLFSLLLHGANGYLVYRLVARQVKGSMGWVIGLAAGLLFLLNPHHAETVSWIAAVGDLAATSCVLSALILFLRYQEAHREVYLLGSLFLFTVGLFTRETGVILPLLLVLSILTLAPPDNKTTHDATGDSISRDASSRIRSLLPVAAYLLPLSLYFGIQALGRGGGSALARGGLHFNPLHADSIALGVMDYVHGLVPGGNLIAELGLDALRVVVWVELALIALLALALWRAGWRMTLFGLGWLVLTPLLFVFFNVPTDRYFYMPTVGYSIVAASLIARLPQVTVRWGLPVRAAKLLASALALALLIPQGFNLAAKERSWHIAGQASGGVYNDVRRVLPEVPNHTNFYFADLPLFLGGIPTFQNAMPQALQLLYEDDTLSATLVTCEQLASAQLPEPAYFFRFKGDGAEQFANAQACGK